MKRSIVCVTTVLLLVGEAVGRPQRAPSGASTRPNVLLIVLDTVRYDATSFGNPTQNNTPFLASLASHSVVFTDAYSTHDFTPTSHFSMFTGLRDGLATADDRVENGTAWQLAHTGYSTFALSANHLLMPEQMPTMRGFSDIRQIVRTGSLVDQIDDSLSIDMRLAVFGFRPDDRLRADVFYSAERLLPITLDQMRSARGPFFGFVNLLDAHEPYVPDPTLYPPEKQLPPNFFADLLKRPVLPELANPDLISDAARRGAVKARLGEVRFPHLLADDLTPAQLAVYRNRYLARVRELDVALQHFFESARHAKLLDNTIVIITSDHGEAFGEKGFVTHMLQEHGDKEANYHVPLVIVLPPRIHRRTPVVDRVVTLDMLAPTIYDFTRVDWSPFRARFPRYAPSLAGFVVEPQPAIARVNLPKAAAQDLRDAIAEREKTMRSLGYVQ